jgi:hypothetical protein
VWKEVYQLRVIVFVENREDVDEERERVQKLLEDLRIDAILIVLCLSSTTTYRHIIYDEPDVNMRVDGIVGEDQWWLDLKQLRHAAETPVAASAPREASIPFVHSLIDTVPSNSGEMLGGNLASRGSTSSAKRPSFSLAMPNRRQVTSFIYYVHGR